MATALVFSLWGISQVYGLPLITPTQRNDTIRTGIGHLETRQSGEQGIPSQCSSNCDPVNVAFGKDGCVVNECCNTNFMIEYFNCLKCVGQAVGITDFTPGQGAFDGLRQRCISADITVPDFSLSGDGPSPPPPRPASPRPASPPPQASQPPAQAPTHETNSHISSPAAPSIHSSSPLPGLTTLNAPVTRPLNQLTITSVDSQDTGIAQQAQPTGPATVGPNSSAVSRHPSTPRSSQLAIISVLFSSFIYLLM